jgi:hypothetical protein
MTKQNGQNSRPGGGSIRLEGNIYSIDELVDSVANLSSGRNRMNRFFSLVLFLVFYFSLGKMDSSSASVLGLLFALFVHEFGHLIGMLLVGWEKIYFSFRFFLFPDAFGDEGISASQKALVALSAPALGMCIGFLLWNTGLNKITPLLTHFTQALLFLSMVNLIPILPFDAGEMIEHLVLIKFPRLEMGYLIISGFVLFIFFYGYYIGHERIIMGLVFLGLAMAQFLGVKRVDNMATMIARLRKEKRADLSLDRYSASTIKRMEFSLACFNVPDQLTLVQILKEVWDRAREVPATFVEVSIIFVSYVLLSVVCFGNPAVWAMIELMK